MSVNKERTRVFKFLEECVLKAEMCGTCNSRHSAAIVHKNKVIAVGYSKRKTHPLMRRFQTSLDKNFLHAEIDAISKVKDKSILKDSVLFVNRLSKGNQILNSEPCSSCKKAIEFYGIKETYWTRNNH